MTFVIGALETVKKKVEFRLPANEGKRPEKQSILVTFKVRTTEETKERQDSMSQYVEELTRHYAMLEKDPTSDSEQPEGGFDERMLEEDITNIEGVRTPDGEELSFDDDLLGKCLNVRQCKSALIKKWNELNLLDPENKKGN